MVGLTSFSLSSLDTTRPEVTQVFLCVFEIKGNKPEKLSVGHCFSNITQSIRHLLPRHWLLFQALSSISSNQMVAHNHASLVPSSGEHAYT